MSRAIISIILILSITVPGAVFQDTLCPTYYCYDFHAKMAKTPSSQWFYCGSRYQNKQFKYHKGQSDTTPIYLLDLCPQDNGHTLCPLSQLQLGQGTFCSKKDPFEKLMPYLPGSACTKNADCISNSCNLAQTPGTCVGGDTGAVCTHNNQCNVGLFCNTGEGKCAKVMGLNESCSTTQPCDPRYMCMGGQCKMWFSGTIGQSVVSASQGRACETGYIADGKCSTGLKRMNTTMISSMPVADACVYQDASGATVPTKQDSVCGMSGVPASYCKIGAEDQEFKVFLDLAKKYTKLQLPQCHIEQGLQCEAAVSKDMRGALAYKFLNMVIEQSPMLMENPDCLLWSVNYYQYYVLTGQFPSKPKPIEPPKPPTPPTPPTPGPEGALGKFVQGFAALVVVTFLTLL